MIKDHIVLTDFEKEFIYAIKEKNVFPVFQPIVDSSGRLKGYEILSRWRRMGKTITPGEFLIHIHCDYVWLMLTESMLHEAIAKINTSYGEIYFSVNIPACLTGTDELFSIIINATKALMNPQWRERLVLEINEAVDIRINCKTMVSIEKLKHQGINVFLDDCFSQSSVTFPVRATHFGGYKLDITIVNDFKDDPYAEALIKSLVYYCQLTKSCCIAEGVDSYEKFNLLKSLGVDYFQGYLFSPPVSFNNLKSNNLMDLTKSFCNVSN